MMKPPPSKTQPVPNQGAQPAVMPQPQAPIPGTVPQGSQWKGQPPTMPAPPDEAWNAYDMWGGVHPGFAQTWYSPYGGMPPPGYFPPGYNQYGGTGYGVSQSPAAGYPNYQDSYWVRGQENAPVGMDPAGIVYDRNSDGIPDNYQMMGNLYGTGSNYGGEFIPNAAKEGIDNEVIQRAIQQYGSNWQSSPEYREAKIRTQIGGVSTVNPQAEDFDFNQVDRFQQQAYDQAMRSLQPQIDAQNDRFAQQLINQGIDPNSEAGREALANLQRGQNDLLSTAKFDALGFGAGLQDQMFGQDLARSQLANQLAQLQAQIASNEFMQGRDLGLGYAQLGEQGRQFDAGLGQRESEFGRGLRQADYQFGAGLNQRGHEFDVTQGMLADQMRFNQMLGLEGLNFRDYQAATDEQRYRDSLAMWLMSMSPQGQFGGSATGLGQGVQADYQNKAADYRQSMWGGY